MPIDFLKKRSQVAGNPGKEMAAEKESSTVKEESDSKESKKASWSGQVNSKVECLHCGKAALSRYVVEYDQDGDEEISLMDCLNCGFKYSYFDKYEKEEKTTDGDSIWWFILMVLSIVTIIIIRGEEGQLLNQGASADRQGGTGRSIERVVGPTVGDYPVRVMNDAEPFRVPR